MKIFAINLQREPNKRKHIIKECEKYSLSIEIIDAVDGRLLSEEYLKENIYNYPDCKLTKGEIGCSLSHLKIYEKIVNENIPVALILEDDAIFMDDPSSCLETIEQHVSKNSKNVYLLSGCLGSYFTNETIKMGNYTFYKAYEAFLTHGYVITQNAANNLLKLQKTIKFEADKWYSFELFGCVKTYCLLPLLIDNNDKLKKNSTLEEDRSDSVRHNDRHNQMRKIYNKNFNIFLKRKILKFKTKIHNITKRSDGLDI